MNEDNAIIARVEEMANKHDVSMTEISLAWMLSKVDVPIVGATKKSHIDGAVGATRLKLSAEDIAYLDELYRPHSLEGVMADNKPSADTQKQAWVMAGNNTNKQ